SSGATKTSGKLSAMTFSSPILISPGSVSCVLFNLSSFPLTELLACVQQSGFGFRFAARRLAPVKRALLNHIHQTRGEQHDEHNHLQENQIAHSESGG